MATTDMKPNYYIGIMSGTSADGIDLALVDFSADTPELIASFYQAYCHETRAKITQLYDSSNHEIEHMGALDVELATLFAAAVQRFLLEQNLTSSDINAIGNHGQTIRHRPPSSSQQYPFTLQIGCNHTLAALTQVRVIGQFRKKDIAYGGQGAPLVPAFHRALLSNNEPLFVVNIGGIANMTYLPSDQNETILGFDTGPGNALLDEWYCAHHNDKSFDENGKWANSGNVNQALLTLLLADDYFSLAAPKSTGREYFHAAWLTSKLAQFPARKTLTPQDIQATLCALTAVSISEQIQQVSTSGNVYLCGGGAHNPKVFNLLKQELKQQKLDVISSIGVDGDALEAMAFAWFAYAYDKNIFGNIPSVTGASRALVLGTEYFA